MELIKTLVDIYRNSGERIRLVFEAVSECKGIITEVNLREVSLIITEIVSLVGRFSLQLLVNIGSKEELYRTLELCKKLSYSHIYYIVQGLNSMNFLCCHVTNAFFGGAASPHSNLYDYNPSVSAISPMIKASLAITERGDINGSIGVIYDYGYIYESYPEDVSTSDVNGKKSGKAFRTGKKDRRIDPGVAVSLSDSSYNELLLRKWTVSGIFYTKGCQDLVVEQLRQISNEMSFKEYINGAYWYRKTPRGTPQRINKVFPVYEIDTSNNIWQIVYVPTNPNFEVKIDSPNNTHIAVPRNQ